MANTASAWFQHEIQAKLTQHGKHLVQLHSGFALLQSVDEPGGHTGERSELVLVKPKLKPPTAHLCGQLAMASCTIVHMGKLTRS